MKVLILTTSWYGGGAETIARESYNYLTKNNIDTYFGYSRGRIPNNVKGIKIGNKLDLYFHVLISRIFDSDGLGSKIATLKLIKKIDKVIKPDIIHIHNIACYTLNYKILFNYLKKQNIKIVWTLHDCWSFTGHCISPEEIECKKYTQICENCKMKKVFPKSILFDNSKRNFLLKKKIFNEIDINFIAPSNWMKTQLKQSFLKNKNVNVVNNGIDLKIFKPTQKINIKKFKDKIVILGVASKWTKNKGLEIFNELPNYLDSNYQVVLIGITKKQKKNVNSKIFCIERTNNKEELIEWYSYANVFVNPTLADNFPTVNLEALACGTPVVTFNTGGSWESVGNEVGELVKSKNAKELAKSIKICINRKISSSKCIEKAKNYEKNNKYAEYIDLYKKILE